MPTLTLDLQEGFTGQTIRVCINGAERYRKAVRTRMQIGRADTWKCALPAGPLELEVATEGAESPSRLSLQMDGDLHVGASLTSGGQIELRTSREPFRYA